MSVLVFGSINLDLVFTVPRLPGPGETVLGPAMRLEPGGKGANQAVAAALDGATVALAGAVGSDALAALALAGVRAAGVDLSRVATLEAATGCAAIAVDPEGRNQIVVSAGANLAARSSQIADSDLSGATVVVLQGECDPAETAALACRARRAGARVVLNLAPFGPMPREALAAATLLVVNEAEAAGLAGALGTVPEATALAASVGTAVVVTLGERGAVLADGQEVYAVPAFAVSVVDTAAAGDALVGVLAAGLDRGLSVRDALRRAVAAASLACTRPGTQASLPTALQTDALLSTARG